MERTESAVMAVSPALSFRSFGSGRKLSGRKLSVCRGTQEVELFHSMAGGEADSQAKPGEGEDQANAPDGGSTPPAGS